MEGFVDDCKIEAGADAEGEDENLWGLFGGAF